MLLQRVLTALILAPLAIGLLFLADAELFALGLMPLILVGGAEWCRLAGVKSMVFKTIYLLLLAVLMVVCYQWPVVIGPLLVLTPVWWLLIGWVITGYPDKQPGWLLSKAPMLLAGPLLLVVSWYAFIVMRGRPEGQWLIMLLFALVWGADIGAYFAGRRWGKVKLMAEVSPGKSWEGVIGGSVAALLVAAIAALAAGQTGIELIYLIVVGMVTAWVSVVGDLAESLFKRRAGVKDSGKLLPGHGGVLDRIDGLVIAAPFFSIAMLGHWQL
ncbi:MAG: phosphatidate cytidylyltransferase [Immundisolibacteraceae bacterium]|nr:phosphatidate cytidylyltransferase [Immundisolibacteraceae bacterium]